MITPIELRIGNRVAVNNGSITEHDVISIEQSTVILKNYPSAKKGELRSGHVKYEHLLPIPLTPAILVRYGLIENELLFDNYRISVIRRNKKDFFVLLNHQIEKLMERGFTSKFYGLNLEFKCNYLHQFQNLYFSLSGKELNKKAGVENSNLVRNPGV